MYVCVHVPGSEAPTHRLRRLHRYGPVRSVGTRFLRVVGGTVVVGVRMLKRLILELYICMMDADALTHDLTNCPLDQVIVSAN